jgi:hypothetical protein
MTRYVVAPDTALRLAAERAVPSEGHTLLAPTLFRATTCCRRPGEPREPQSPCWAAATSTGRPVSRSQTSHSRATAASVPGRTSGFSTGGPLVTSSGP